MYDSIPGLGDLDAAVRLWSNGATFNLTCL